MEIVSRLRLKQFDWIIPITAIILVIIGLFTIQSTILASYATNPVLNSKLLNVQLLAFAIGLLLFIIISNLDYKLLKIFATPIYFFAIIALAAVLIFGQLTRGSMRWFEIGPINIQPATISIVFFVIAFAALFERLGKKINSIQNLFICILLVGLPIALIAVEPDLGSAVILFSIWLTLLFLSPLTTRHLLMMLFTFILLAPIVWVSLANYQRIRVESFLNPNQDPTGTGYNMIQSIIAVGSGQIWGRGWGQGKQSHLQYLPEQHTDFIFATFAEEQGFVGSVIVVILYFVMLSRCFIIVQKVPDFFGKLLGYGLITWFFLHVFVNIGMNLGIAPITGIPLPLISYGGTSMITALMALGLIESIKKHSIT